MFSPTSLGSSLWHSQERHRDCRHVRHAAGAHHEVHHPCRHGGYHCHLRPGGGRAHCQQHRSKSWPPQVSAAHHVSPPSFPTPASCSGVVQGCGSDLNYSCLLVPWCWCFFVSLHVQEFPVFGRRVECGPQRTGSRLRHWHRRRRWCERLGTAAQALCGHDPHLDFRWGLGSLRAHRCPHSVHKIIII